MPTIQVEQQTIIKNLEINVLSGIVFVESLTVLVDKNDEVLSKSEVHRRAIVPDADIEDEPEEIQTFVKFARKNYPAPQAEEPVDAT